MYLAYMLKRNFLVLAVVAALISWALTSTIMLLKKTDTLVLIGIDQNGTRIISKLDDPLFKVEVINFVKRFFGLLYNFDASTFDQNVGLASDFMSLELWKSQEAQVTKLGQDVKKEKMSHVSEVKSLMKNDDGSFEVVLSTTESYRAKTVTQDLQIKLKIRKIERSAKNPWGMEITSLDETKI